MNTITAQTQQICKDTLAETTWPESWDEITPIYESYIGEREFYPTGLCTMRTTYSAIIAKLPSDPRSVTLEQLLKVRAGLNRHLKVVLTHLRLLLAGLGVWPTEWVLLTTEQSTIKRCLPTDWQIFLDDFGTYLKKEGVTTDGIFKWRKWVTTFIWWYHFLPDGELDGEALKKNWGEFADFLDKSDHDDDKYNRKSYQRAFAIFWNFAILRGRLKAEPLPVERVATTFWSQIHEPLRVSLNRRFPLSGGIRSEHENWLYTLKYVLGLLGFSIYRPETGFEVTEPDLERVREKLIHEKFLPETAERVLSEIMSINQEMK